MFKNWTWQKWVSRGSKFLMLVAVAFFKFIAPEAEPDWAPTWWPILEPLVMMVIDGILALFKPKISA